ncbi:phosphomannomutase/phosphoglucomutase [Patescibacteria group bacterium]|nr:phosphomannomutase/phosphoglucomutase [Patescibacteria group bacterium]
MKINPNIFRAYDIRGIYPDDLNEIVVSQIVKAFCVFYPKAQKIVLSRDPRLSSPSLYRAAINALIAAGREVIDIGVSSDPLFYFSIFHYHFDGGIMISGSHNPKEYNGLTLHIRKPDREISEDVIGKDLEKIKKMVTKGEKIDLPEAFGQRGKITILDPARDYINFVTARIELKRPLKIIIDSGNGACGFLPEKVFKKLGCQVETLYGDFDGNFPHHLPDPYQEKNLLDIQKRVLEKKADLGLAFDADGDRVAPIDNQGRRISGDFCLLMLARQILQKKRGPVVHCMRVSKAFLDEMEKEGIKTYFSVSHHNAVIEKIIEKGAVFGGEITYHFLFPLDYYLCDEAIFSSLKLAEVASKVKDLANHVDSLPRYYASPEVFIDSTDGEKFKIIENLEKYLRERNFDFIDVDGARINFSGGWALARASNTEPKIKCRFEGETKEDLIRIEKKALEIFKKVEMPVTEKTYLELGLKE